MPSLSLEVGQSTHDGHVPWSSRSAASGTVFNSTLLSSLGCHLDPAQVHDRFFIFRFGNGNIGSGIPQGTTINAAKLELRFNNAAPAAGLHNHAYICVENNLDPTGTGAITNGTLGSQPWQRLGRQSAATTLLGNRCGPTHTGDLATVGKGVRDPEAYVYKAFADAREVPFGTWAQTDDFTGALQALVNDPGWSSSSQYVMVHMFSDHRISAGTTGGVGYLGGVSWASGQSGTVGEGNAAAAQIYFYDQGPATYPPKLLVDYTVNSFNSLGGGATSSGNIRLQPAVVMGRQRGERTEFTTGNPVLPKVSTGAHDLPLTGMSGVVNPNDVGWLNGNPLGARLKWSNQLRQGRVDGYPLFIEDYAGATPQIWWDIDTYQNEYPTRDIYSLRFYHKYDRDSVLNGINPLVARFSLAGVDSFRIEHQVFVPGFPAKGMELRISWPGGSTAWTTYSFNSLPSGQFYRYELQVDASQNPKVRVRIYLNDEITPLAVINANPITVEMDRVLFGDIQPDALVLFSVYLADFEMWSDYLLNRQYPDSISNEVGTPYSPQEWAWHEYDGGTNSKALEDLGTISSIDPDGSNVVIASNTALTLEDTNSEVWDGGVSSYTKYSNLGYGTGSRRLDLYVPVGTAPVGGWPLIMWTHGGFWVSGNRGLIPEQFVIDCTLRGYAVASCSYILGGTVVGNPYPAWNTAAATGRYPSFILDYKEAAYWLTTQAATYDLNVNKFIASGHSAGGYNALGAAVSTGLTNDGSGRNITLAGNVVSFGCSNVPDPTFIGAYVFAGPINLDGLKAWDPTHTDWPFLGLGIGTINATARIFMGERVDNGTGITTNTGIDNMVIRNAANVPSVCYAWGGSDHLVVSARFTPYSQEAYLANAFSSVSGSLPADTVYEGHEVPDALHHTIHDIDFDYEHFFRWLENLPGLQ